VKCKGRISPNGIGKEATMARNATLVLSGGGAKGAFEVGAEEVLRNEGGFEWDHVFGVSVGALNGTLLAQQQYDRLRDIWENLREKDVHKKFGWFTIAWRLAVERKRGLYDNRPLRELIQKYAGGGQFKIPLYVGRVSLVSGRYELVSYEDPDILDAVWQSATMPIIWEPLGAKAYVDGGLRNLTPLGDALKQNPDEIVVILCNPQKIQPAAPPKDIVNVATRSLTEITLNEIALNDVREFMRINSLVQQANEAGLTLKDNEGDPLRYCPITVIQPSEPLGDTLDFSQSAIRMRLDAGRAAAQSALNASASSV
jgi:NTE family protein